MLSLALKCFKKTPGNLGWVADSFTGVNGLITSPSKLCGRKIILRGHSNSVFIFVFWVLLEIFLPRAMMYDGCWDARKTQGRKESCYGDLRQIMSLWQGWQVHYLTQEFVWSTGDRSRRMTTDVRTLCQKHSPKLTALPRGLYQYIDKQGGKTKKYRPGSKWCYKFQASSYKQPGLPIIERRKVTFTYENVSLYHSNFTIAF